MDVRNGDSSRYKLFSIFDLAYMFGGEQCNFSSLIMYLCFSLLCFSLCICALFFSLLTKVYNFGCLCFSQLVNHGISEELLERVKKVTGDFFRMEREENFKNSTLMKAVNENKKLENVDWEDVFTLLDDNEWPSKTPGFK